MHLTTLLTILALGISSSSSDVVYADDVDTSCTCGNGKAKLWGPGGPHTALVPAAAIYNAQRPETQPEIEICWGPEGTWRSEAQECAAGLFSAAEQQMAGFLRTYGNITNTDMVTPITMHPAALVVVAGNPKNITGLNDLVSRDDIGIVVNDGNFHDTLTSGTGVWEDVIGRLMNINAMSSVRSKIKHFASGSGDARDMLLDEDSPVDVWISWYDWFVAAQKAETPMFDAIAIEPEYVIIRDLAIAETNLTDEGSDVVRDFVGFTLASPEVEEAMAKEGWMSEWNEGNLPTGMLTR